MKVAVCISGQPRSFAKGFEYLKKNLLDHYDTDIFIHTWNNRVVKIDDIIDLYKPVMYRSEDYICPKELLNAKYTHTPDAKNFPPANAVYAFYSLFQANFLKTRHEVATKQYDWVIKTRFDYALNGMLVLKKFDPTKLYIPNCRRVITRDFGNDQFAVSSSNVMNLYASTFLYLDEFYAGGYMMNGEEMMRATIRYHNLHGERLVYIDMNNPFPPGPYNGTPHSLIRDDFELWRKS